MKNVIKQIWNTLQYVKLYRRINAMSEKQQRVVSQRIYEEAYDVMKLAKGEELGACSVVFECPYDGHVSYCIEKTLSERVSDAADPAVMSEVSRLDDGRWVATAVVKAASEQDAITAADACVMSAVLKSSTVSPAFAKYLARVDSRIVDGREQSKVIADIRAEMRAAATA